MSKLILQRGILFMSVSAKVETDPTLHVRMYSSTAPQAKIQPISDVNLQVMQRCSAWRLNKATVRYAARQEDECVSLYAQSHEGFSFQARYNTETLPLKTNIQRQSLSYSSPMQVEASCAICGAHAYLECPHESERLAIAVR